MSRRTCGKRGQGNEEERETERCAPAETARRTANAFRQLFLRKGRAPRKSLAGKDFVRRWARAIYRAVPDARSRKAHRARLRRCARSRAPCPRAGGTSLRSSPCGRCGRRPAPFAACGWLAEARRALEAPEGCESASLTGARATRRGNPAETSLRPCAALGAPLRLGRNASEARRAGLPEVLTRERRRPNSRGRRRSRARSTPLMPDRFSDTAAQAPKARATAQAPAKPRAAPSAPLREKGRGR